MSANLQAGYELYLSGIGIKKCARIIRVNYTTLRNFCISKGVDPSDFMKKNKVDERAVIDFYNQPNTVKKTAEHFGVSRNVIQRVLKQHGVGLRSASESNIIRASKMTFKERQKSAEAANNAVKNAGKEFHRANSIKQAITKQKTQSKIGFGEQQVFDSLKNFGYSPVLQKAFDIYNIDIACGNVAVEVHNSPDHPHTNRRIKKRIKYLLERGLNVVYFKINGSFVFDSTGLNNLVKLVDVLNRNPPPTCQYWMIRGTGKIEFTGTIDQRNNLSIKPAPKDFLEVKNI
jgi:transposase-like protein